MKTKKRLSCGKIANFWMMKMMISLICIEVLMVIKKGDLSWDLTVTTWGCDVETWI